MSIYKRGNVYWYKFMWNGEVIRESTKQGNDRIARNMEAAHRTRLSKQKDARNDACERLKCSEVLLCDECEKWFAAPEAHQKDSHTFCSGVCLASWTKRHTRIVTLAEFLKDDFEPFVKTRHAEKPATIEYYLDGAKMVKRCDWASEPLDKITDQHAQHFAAKYGSLSPSRINCGLRSLRRALNLAYEWGKLEKPVKITLAKGERQRDTVLSDADWQRYILECPQPWQDAAIIIRGTGMRPGEAFALKWENIHLNGSGGLVQVTEGKTKAARRMLPLVPLVYATLKARWERAGKPEDGWIFPAESREGHLNKDTAKDQHRLAIERVNAKAKENRERELKPFVPYVLRHTALTQLAESGCDVFTLARIAGHSSITITQRYVHPQADAIERAFLGLERPALPREV